MSADPVNLWSSVPPVFKCPKQVSIRANLISSHTASDIGSLSAVWFIPVMTNLNIGYCRNAGAFGVLVTDLLS